MKKAAHILKEMGFRKEAPESLKEAFIRHLIKSATGVAVQPGPQERKENLQSKAIARSAPTPAPIPKQLAFDFSADLSMEHPNDFEQRLSSFDAGHVGQDKKTS